MAVLFADLHRASAPRWHWALLALLATSAVALAASPKRNDMRIEVDAASTVIDFRNNTAVLRTVVIREGDVRVEANEATATGGVDNFENNQWVLTGGVRIKMPNGELEADRAVVSFVDNRIVRTVITGSPASFEQKIEESDTIARGRAATIEYDVVAGKVRLRGGSYLTDGRNEITGEALVYSIIDQRVLASEEEQGGKRVHFKINPNDVEVQREDQKKKQEPTGEPPPDPTPPQEPPGS